MYLKQVLIVLTTFRCLALTSVSDYELDEGVIVLTEESFDKATDEFRYLLVDFYAPWCGHCKALQPEYEKLSGILERTHSEIRLGKVDATVEKALADKYDIKGYPTVKLFRQGSLPVECRSSRTADEMLAWLKKKTGSSVERLTDVRSAQELIDQQDVIIIGFFKDLETSTARTYIELADTVDDVVFGLTSNEDIFKEYKVNKDAIVVFKKFDEGRVDLAADRKLTSAEIKDLIEFNRLPLVVEFNEDTAPNIFARAVRIHILMFISKDSTLIDMKLREYKNVASQFKGKLLFVYIDVDPDENKRVLDYFGLKRSSCPTYRIINLDGNVKYKPDADEPSEHELAQFINEVLTGDRKPHLMTEEIPKDWDANTVVELVGKNYEEVVKDNTKDVLVQFYAPWCGHCKALTPTWQELGDKYKDRDDVIIAKIDATQNEVDGIKITIFPTVKLYPKDSDEVLEFPPGVNKTLDRLVHFLEFRGEILKDEKKEETPEEDTKKDEL